MRIQKFIAVCLLSTTLVGCGDFLKTTTVTTTTTPTGTTTTTTQPSADAALATAESALTVAENAHTAVGKLLVDAVNAGILKGANATTAKQYYDQAGALLDQAEAADKAVNASGVLGLVANVQYLLSKASALVGGK